MHDIMYACVVLYVRWWAVGGVVGIILKYGYIKRTSDVKDHKKMYCMQSLTNETKEKTELRNLVNTKLSWT